MNDIQIFKNDRFGEVRVTEVNGNPYFVAKDVCEVLAISNNRDAVSRLDDDEKCAVGIADAIGREQMMTVVSESGLYELIFQSRKPEAKAFKKWVKTEVLPSIRKTGSYTMALPKTYSEALRQLADVVEANEKIQLQLEAKTRQLDESEDWYSIKRWAKEHRMNWRKISWRALKAISAEHGFEVQKIFDGNYGEVNIYHRQVFAILFGK